MLDTVSIGQSRLRVKVHSLRLNEVISNLTCGVSVAPQLLLISIVPARLLVVPIKEEQLTREGQTQRSLTPAMKIIGVLLLFMFTRAATAVTCATGTAVNCNACLYRFSEAGHMDIDTDNCDNSPDCKMVDDTCQDRPPLPSSTPTPYTSPPSTSTSATNTLPWMSPTFTSATHIREIIIKTKDTGRRYGRAPRRAWFVTICSDGICCTTDNEDNVGRTTFSPIRRNLGDCRQFVKGDTLSVAVNQINPSRQVNLREISVYFDDESVFTEAETLTRNFWGREGTIPLEWNTYYHGEAEVFRNPATTLPPPTCPSTNHTNTCHRDNVLIYRRIADRQRRCFYQE